MTPNNPESGPPVMPDVSDNPTDMTADIIYASDTARVGVCNIIGTQLHIGLSPKHSAAEIAFAGQHIKAIQDKHRMNARI